MTLALFPTRRRRSRHVGPCLDCRTTAAVERESIAAFERSVAAPSAHSREVADRLLSSWLRRLKCPQRHVMATDPFADTLPEEIL